LLSLAAFALVAALVLLPLGLGFVLMWGLTHVPCAAGGNPVAYNLTYEDVTIPMPRGDSLRGFFLPGINGATVIVVPALANDRGGDLRDAALLNAGGFNVLTFDSTVCAGRGIHSLGYAEADDAIAAYDYLSSRADVDPQRVSIHGFSSAGATSLFAAARLPALRAVSAMGGYHNMAEQLGLGQDYGFVHRLMTLGAEVGYRLNTGLDVRVLSPLSVIDSIQPRPILLIYGSREVSLAGARQMQARAEAAGGNVELWVVDGAGHGNYAAHAGDTFGERLVAFHRAALLEP
jgi:dipeptidyl aminopeptidase/acylaminoacyl peptidase